MKVIAWPPRSKIIFSEEAKTKLREPVGELITGGSPDEVTAKIGEIIKKSSPPVVISVGDYVSSKLHEHKIRVDIYVIDGKVERAERPAGTLSSGTVLEAVNDAGTISPESAERLHTLIHSPEKWPAILRIAGEEDLLAAAAIISSPEGSVVVYGQPGKGAVVVRVNEQTRGKILEVIGDLVE